MESWVRFDGPQKHFWSVTTKQRCSILRNNWRRWWLVSKWKIQQQLENNKQTKQKVAPCGLCGAIQVSGSPAVQNWFEKMLFITSNGCFQPSSYSKDFSLKKGYKSHFLLNQFHLLASWHLGYTGKAACSHFVFFTFKKKSPSASVV